MPRVSRAGFALIEAIAVLIIAVVLVSMLLPALFASRRTARSMQSNTQIRGIHQACYTFSESNNGQLPGLAPQGHVLDATTRGRFELLLTNDFFTGEYAVSPVETRPIWTDGPVTAEHYSFAMLDITPLGTRRASWSRDLNPDAISISDRNAGSNTTDDLHSIHTVDTPGEWRGALAWADNHVSFETTHRFDTRMGASRIAFDGDHLFESVGPDDTLMQHTP